jgi:anti-anti-sigma factor
MSVSQREVAGSIWVVAVSGRLDQSQTTNLETNLGGLLDEGHARFVVDLAEVSYINSGGLRCLVAAWRRARKAEGDLYLCSLNKRLSEVFTMVGFDKVFSIHATCEAAISALQLT